MVRGGDLSWRAALHAGALLGLALLAKFSAVIYGVALLAVVGRQAMGEKRWSNALGNLAEASGVAALLRTPWIVRNLLLYGNATAEHVANVPFDWGGFWRKLAQDTRVVVPANWPGVRNALALPVLMLNVLLTFWSVSGLEQQRPQDVFAPWFHVRGRGLPQRVAAHLGVLPDLCQRIRGVQPGHLSKDGLTKEKGLMRAPFVLASVPVPNMDAQAATSS